MSVLSIKNLEKRFGDLVVFKNINVEVNKGDVISIIGPSGTGKSTFLRAINFLSPPTDGEVYFKEEKIMFSYSNEISSINRVNRKV